MPSCFRRNGEQEKTFNNAAERQSAKGRARAHLDAEEGGVPLHHFCLGLTTEVPATTSARRNQCENNEVVLHPLERSGLKESITIITIKKGKGGYGGFRPFHFVVSFLTISMKGYTRQGFRPFTPYLAATSSLLGDLLTPWTPSGWTSSGTCGQLRFRVPSLQSAHRACARSARPEVLTSGSVPQYGRRTLPVCSPPIMHPAAPGNQPARWPIICWPVASVDLISEPPSPLPPPTSLDVGVSRKGNLPAPFSVKSAPPPSPSIQAPETPK